MNLNRKQFLKTVERGKALLEELRKDYPELKLKPVFSRFGPRSGQCDLTTELKKIVMEFPEMLSGEFIHRALERSEKIILHSKIVTNGNDSRSQRSQKVGTGRRAVRNAGESDGHENSQRWNETSRRVQEEESFSHKKAQNSQKESVKRLRELLFEIRRAEKEDGREKGPNLWKEVDEVEKRLLDPELKLYCGDVLIEFRPGVLKYESLRCLQQDPRLPQDLNEVGTIRVVAGSLQVLEEE